MFRRSRFSIRPNVGTAGRTAATPQEASAENQETSETPKDSSDNNTATAVIENKSLVTPSEKPAEQGDSNDQNGESANSSAAVQRRKRFSVKPKVAPGRPSILARTTKSPVKAVPVIPVKVSESDHDTSATTSQSMTTVAPQGLHSPRRRRPSEESKQPRVQPKQNLIPSDSSGLPAVATAEDSLKTIHQSADSGKHLESASGKQIKEAPFRLSEKVPPSLPDKEAIEISEKAKTLASSKIGHSPSPAAFCLSRLLNDPSDLQRLAKARKLRELLREEMHKEKKIKKSKMRAKAFTLDPAKMTMRDLIHYLPESNPMTSRLEDPTPEDETVVPPSPCRRDSPERAMEPAAPAEVRNPSEADEEEEAAEEDQEEAFLVPQVKVAEDGSLIIDEESLTVEVNRAKGPNPAQDRDPIFERGSTTTYSSFRKGTYSKPWSSEETDMFFLAISMVGTDFTMICQLFPHRARSEIKNKFKKEERENAWRIDKAFRERRKLDIEYFSKLLEKILEVQKNRKKLKTLAEKNCPKKYKRRANGKKVARKLSDVEEEEEDDMPDLEEEEEEGEKENEDLCNECQTPLSKPKNKCQRTNGHDATTNKSSDQKNKTNEKSTEQGIDYTHEDPEAALLENSASSDMCGMTENSPASKYTAIKPAKLTQGKTPQPLLHLGRKLGKKPPSTSTKTKDATSDKEDESVNDGATEEQVNKDESAIKQGSKRKLDNDGISSEEEDITSQPQRPTRYGRMPKPTKPLTYPAKEDTHSSASETTPASPPGSTAPGTSVKTKCTTKKKRSSKSKSVQQPKKPKLVTLRASQTEYSDDEDGVGEEQHPACSSSISAFVPASLCSLHPVSLEVEETMEEFDILVNMPDVLGISQDALYPDVTCKKTQNETAEPCEHQLDQLVDVMECLASEYTVSEEESYNEAAQTLLTISNLAHVTQSAQNQTPIQDQTIGTELLIVDETRPNIEQHIVSSAAQEENAHVMSAASFQGVTETVETIANREPQTTLIDNSDMTVMSDQKVEPSLQLLTIPENSERISSQTRRGRLPKMKPKPTISQALRTGQSKSQPDTSVGTSTVESHTGAPSLSKSTESPTVAEVTPAKADLGQKCSRDEMSSTEAGVPEAASGTQEMSVDQITGAATSDHCTSENQSHCLSETRLDPSLEHTSRESTDETLLSEVSSSQSSYLVNPDTAVTELPRTNIDRIQQSNDEPGPSHMLLKEFSLTQKEESEVRESQFQEVNPNLTKASEAVHISQTTKYSNPTSSPNEKSTENLAVIESESTCISLPDKNQNTGLDFDSVPSSDVDRTEGRPTSEDRKMDVEVISEVHSRAALSDQSTSENGCVPEATKDTSPQSESMEEKKMSQAGTVETSLGPGSYTESATAQESRDRSAPFITHVEELPVCQKEERALVSTRPSGKSQFHKVKPKPNIALTSRTVRSKSVTAKDTIEQNSNQRSNPQIYKKATVEGEAEPLLITSAEKVNQNPDPGSSLIQIANINASLTPVEELPTTDEKETAKESSTDQCVSENTNFSENQFESSGEEAIRDTSSTCETTAEKLMSDAEILDSAETLGSGSITDTASVQESCHLALNIPHMEEIPVSHKEEIKVAPACQARKGRKVKPKPNLPQSLRTVQCKPQSTVEPVKPMVVEKPSSPTSGPLSSDISVAGLGAQPTCTAILPGKPNQITGSPLLSVFSCELSSTQEPAEQLPSTEGQKTDVTSSEVPSSKNLPERRQRFSRVKPNLGSSSRNTVTKLRPGDDNEPPQVNCINTSADVTSEQQPVNNDDAQIHLQLKEENTPHLTSTHCSQQLISSTNLAPANSEKLVDDTNDGGTTNDGCTTSDGVAIAACLVAENQHVWTGSAVESESCEKPAVKVESTGDLVAAVFISQWDCKQDTAVAVAETNSKAVDNPTAIPDIQSSENGTTESALKLTVDPKESTQQPNSENASGLKSQDAITQSSETAEANPVGQSTHDSKSEPTSSSESSRKAFPTRRGRLVKPKPNLGHSSRPKQIQNITQADAGSVAHSKDGDAGISHKPPVLVEPVEGATEQQSSSPHNADSSLQLLAQADEQLNGHSPPNVAGSSLGCSTHVDNNYTQDGAAFNTGGNQSQASLSIFSHMLQEQVPSDPDEPFFILSLTEIPVYSVGEMGGSTAEPLPGVPVTELSVQNQSISEDVLVAAEDGPLANVTVSEATVETGLMSVKEIVPGPAAYKGSNLENPVDPHRVENSEETEHPLTKETKSSSHEASTAKKQFKPKTQRKKQDSKSIAAESISSEILEQPGLPVEPKASVEVDTDSKNGSGDHVNITMVAPVVGKNPEETTQTSRKRKGSTSASTDNAAPCDSPPGTAASKRQKVKTPCRAEKPSTSHDVAPTHTQIQSSQETHPAPSAFSPTHAPVDKEQTASCSQPLAFSTSPAEFSAFQESDSKEYVSVQDEEQPTSVSQYFLSDIFTEVEDD